jgi:hypothetical protein
MRAELKAAPVVQRPKRDIFRTALRAASEVEKFLLLYLIVATLRPNSRGDDDQSEVDAFIRHEEPGVHETPRPRFSGRDETIYSRLRNEIAHRRLGTNLHTTRGEIARKVDALKRLAKRAIELYA